MTVKKKNDCEALQHPEMYEIPKKDYGLFAGNSLFMYSILQYFITLITFPNNAK